MNDYSNKPCPSKRELDYLPDPLNQVGWLIVLGFNVTSPAMVISWRSVTQVCVYWLSHTSTNTPFFPRPQTTFLTSFSRGEGRKYAEKEVRLNRVSNSQPPGHESDTLTTEPAGH